MGDPGAAVPMFCIKNEVFSMGNCVAGLACFLILGENEYMSDFGDELHVEFVQWSKSWVWEVDLCSPRSDRSLSGFLLKVPFDHDHVE